jgi:hypothetical protein
VDNVLKPLLDALKGVVFEDDDQVHRVVSEKVSLEHPLQLEPTPTLASALGCWSEAIWVRVAWEDE